MSRAYDQLSRASEDLKIALGGEKGDKPIDVALSRAEQWSVSSSWLLVEARGGGGGSSFDARERKEERKVVARATAAVGRIPHLVRELEAAAKALRAEVSWLVATVDPSQLPPPEPECKSCRREGNKGTSKIGNHFAPVYEKAKGSELCRWCHDFDLEYGVLPPIEACDLRHTQSPEKAGRWLATWIRDNHQRKAS